MDVRIEVLVSKEAHAAHFPTAPNRRNVAAGTVRRLDGKGAEHLSCVAFGAWYPENGEPVGESYASTLNHLVDYGFSTGGFTLVLGDSTPQKVYGAMQALRDSLPFDTDGIVFRTNDNETFVAHGAVNARPRAAVAWKWPPDQGVSTLLDVIWQTGAGGRITPVAIIEPTVLAGASVSRASLSTIGRIRSVGFHIGDRVLAVRRGDVIPYIENVVEMGSVRKPIEPPQRCPSCGSAVIVSGEWIRCEDTSRRCPAQVAGRLRRFCDTLGMLGWGENLFESLVGDNAVSNVFDVMRLDAATLSAVRYDGRRLGDVTAATLLAERDAAPDFQLAAVLDALSLDGVSAGIAGAVAAAFKTFEATCAATTEALGRVEGVGPTRAAGIERGLRDVLTEGNISVADAKALLRVRDAEDVTGPLLGMKFCFTGFRDASLEDEIKSRGGEIKSSAVKGLTCLLADDPSGSSTKIAAARKSGTEVLGVEDFRAKYLQ